MNQTKRTVALFAMLSLAAVGCQKETILEPLATIAETGTVYTVHYAIDGVMHSIVLHGEQERSEFINRSATALGIGTVPLVGGNQ